MLMRFDPFRELDRWSQRLDVAGRGPAIPMDAYRRDGHLVVHLDLPGADPDAIDLTVEKNVVTVRAERSITRGEGEEWLVAERPHGSFMRQLFLGESLDTDAIDAHYDQGVLTLTVPVAEAAKPRKVGVASGGQKAIDSAAAAAA